MRIANCELRATETLVDALRQGLRGEVRWDEPTLAAYTTDFTGVAHKPPRLVVLATCEQDLFHCLQVARAAGVPITLRGSGHSGNGQALCQDGILVVNLAEMAEFSMVDEKQVAVSGRSGWGALERALNRLGRSIPVLPNYLDLSVGGTLAVGGYGERSVVYGAQVDQVVQLRLLKPDGSALACSPAENAELFQYSLGGLGQLGVIEEAMLRTIPYRKLTKVFIYHHATLDQWLAALAQLAQWPNEPPEHFSAYFVNGLFVTTYGLEFTSRVEALYSKPHPLLGQTAPDKTLLLTDYPFIQHRMTQESIRRLQDHWQLAVDYFLDYDQLSQFIPVLQSQLEQSTLARYLLSPTFYLLAVRRRTDLLPLPLTATVHSDAPLLFSLGLRPMIPKADNNGLQNVRQTLRVLLEKCMELGGRPYLYGSHELERQDKERLYGHHYARLLELRRALDPQGLLNAGAL